MKTFWEGGGRILLGDKVVVMLRPIRFLGVEIGISVWLASVYRHSSPCVNTRFHSPSYTNTQFRLALGLPERNCCLSREMSVAYLFTQNLSPALCVWFGAVTWTNDCNLWGTCKLIELCAALGLCASCTVSTPLTDSKTRSYLLTHVTYSLRHVSPY